MAGTGQTAARTRLSARTRTRVSVRARNTAVSMQRQHFCVIGKENRIFFALLFMDILLLLFSCCSVCNVGRKLMTLGAGINRLRNYSGSFRNVLSRLLDGIGSFFPASSTSAKVLAHYRVMYVFLLRNVGQILCLVTSIGRCLRKPTERNCVVCRRLRHRAPAPPPPSSYRQYGRSSSHLDLPPHTTTPPLPLRCYILLAGNICKIQIDKMPSLTRCESARHTQVRSSPTPRLRITGRRGIPPATHTHTHARTHAHLPIHPHIYQP